MYNKINVLPSTSYKTTYHTNPNILQCFTNKASWFLILLQTESADLITYRKYIRNLLRYCYPNIQTLLLQSNSLRQALDKTDARAVHTRWCALYKLKQICQYCTKTSMESCKLNKSKLWLQTCITNPTSNMTNTKHNILGLPSFFDKYILTLPSLWYRKLGVIY